jgi:rSAM/selenodomain-associated transferase 2
MVPMLSIIMPVLDEATLITAALQPLAAYRRRGAEVLVVDGGSRDATIALAQPHADQVIASPRGRAAQMNAGAAIARGEVLLFLHADTQLPEDADAIVLDGIERSGRSWGRFDVRITGRNPVLTVVAAAMNLRSRLTGIATGDQAMFVTRAAFQRVGGFPDIPLMEDVALSRALKRISAPLCLRARAVTSGRRWEQRGIWRTIVLMWRLRLAYFLGGEPAIMARCYGYAPHDH